MTQTKFITLGIAGGPTPKPTGAYPSHAVVHGEQTILVDCGEGAFSQLKRAGIPSQKVNEVFITHHHFDHIGSLFALLGLNMMLHRSQPLNIYGPPGIGEIVSKLIEACDIPHQIGFGVAGQTLPHPREFVRMTEINPGDVIEVGHIKVSCCENTHYHTEDQFGQDGPLSLSLRFDAPDRSMVFTGDTGPCKAVEELAKGAQLLVGELMEVDYVVKRIRKNNPQMSEERVGMMSKHLTEHHLLPEQLGELAARAGVDQVVAVHIPLDVIDDETVADLTTKIASTFSGKICIGEDLASY